MSDDLIHGLTPEDFAIYQRRPMHRTTRRADERDAAIMRDRQDALAFAAKYGYQPLCPLRHWAIRQGISAHPSSSQE